MVDPVRFWWPDAPGPEETVPELLASRVAVVGDTTALIAPSLVRGDEIAWTYRELADRVAVAAGALAAAGVGPGDRVGVLVDNDGAAEAHVAYHAVHRLGAICVPLNTRYVARELAYVLGFVTPAAIVHGPRFRPLLEQVAQGEVLLDVSTGVLEAPHPAVDAVPVRGDDDADWLFTSGTTGRPKAVALSHRGSVACGYQGVGAWGVRPGSVYQSFAPFFTSTGSHTNLLGCLAAGCTYVVEPEFDVHATLDRMQRHRTTSVFLISSVLALILDRRTPAELDAYDFAALERICYGGQPSSQAFYRRTRSEIGERWGVELVNIYGLTEGGTSGIMLVADDHLEALDRMGDNGLSIGRTGFREWVGFEVRRTDSETTTAPGEVGELCLRGPSTMSRYVSDPEATRRALPGEGWLRTGDMATTDDAGFVYFVDRNAALIRRGGLNVSSVEVEGVLLEHPGVAEVAVVPMPNEVLGSDVRAVVVPVGVAPDPAELIDWCAQRLADYKVPVRVDFVEALPRNGMNRVIKGVLTGDADAMT
ncbi:o-succinylbenzoate--CoA ligase [Pseudonocardia dioxanivorans CB1190]|uniref:O-succinylbenzoate--CoA ligase n=1 Tax=Pseudonocardia dioxanivorans (strain ATCC 55486 / DSM 44775 / JCM 13855 / CB1190) TaxID=675635 RepID=F4CX36_PSEUX|nr:class I adenylate-forming enzyme family protein [Pseudonocardia dioxanivorans]AEA24667.1 o-succinylbenzoate--CoA ligase [Pseudonocardia dioxanivorans CB1190]